MSGGSNVVLLVELLVKLIFFELDALNDAFNLVFLANIIFFTLLM